MSILGKIALGLAIVASLASLGLGYKVAIDKRQFSDQLVNTEAALKKAPSPITYTANFKTNTAEPASTINKYNTEISTVQKNLSDTKSQLSDKEAALTKSQVEVTRLTEEVTSAKGDAEKAKKELEENKTASAATAKELDDLKKSLQGNDPATLITDLAKNKDDLKISQDQNKTLEVENKTLVAEVQRLQDLDKRRVEKTAPPDFTAKVVAINRPWNFVVLDAGLDKKLVEGVELVVYRGNQLIGKVRTVNVDNKTAVADVLSDWTKSQIQIGDQVLF